MNDKMGYRDKVRLNKQGIILASLHSLDVEDWEMWIEDHLFENRPIITHPDYQGELLFQKLFRDEGVNKEDKDRMKQAVFNLVKDMAGNEKSVWDKEPAVNLLSLAGEVYDDSPRRVDKDFLQMLVDIATSSRFPARQSSLDDVRLEALGNLTEFGYGGTVKFWANQYESAADADHEAYAEQIWFGLSNVSLRSKINFLKQITWTDSLIDSFSVHIDSVLSDEQKKNQLEETMALIDSVLPELPTKVSLMIQRMYREKGFVQD